MQVKVLSSKEVVRVLKKNGWYLVKTKGSHQHFKHLSKKGKVTVPFKTGSENIKIKTLKSIFKQAAIKQEEI